jgi:hypothetical protein
LPLPFQPVPGAAEIVMRFALADGDEAVNTFGAQNASGLQWTASDLALLATAVGNWYGTGDGAGNTYRSRVSNAVTCVAVDARDLTVDGSTFGTHAVGTLGQDTAAPLPSGVSFVVKSLSGLTGRSNRGRCYLNGLTTDSQHATDKNQVLAAAVTEWVLAFNALIPAVVAYGGVVGAHLCIISRHHAGVRLTTGVTKAVTSWATTNTDLAYRRSRTPGH